METVSYTHLDVYKRQLQAFDLTLRRNPAGCASLNHALHEYLTPPILVILRGEPAKLQLWRHAIPQHYYPHALFFYFDETVKELPKTLLRNFSKDVNAWVCRGVTCSRSIANLAELLGLI